MCHRTFINSSALLMSLMALRLSYGTETPLGLVICKIYPSSSGTRYTIRSPMWNSPIKSLFPLLIFSLQVLVTRVIQAICLYLNVEVFTSNFIKHVQYGFIIFNHLLQMGYV